MVGENRPSTTYYKHNLPFKNINRYPCIFSGLCLLRGLLWVTLKRGLTQNSKYHLAPPTSRTTMLAWRRCLCLLLVSAWLLIPPHHTNFHAQALHPRTTHIQCKIKRIRIFPRRLKQLLPHAIAKGYFSTKTKKKALQTLGNCTKQPWMKQTNRNAS